MICALLSRLCFDAAERLLIKKRRSLREINYRDLATLNKLLLE
jgi:hypothetical protein